MKFDIRAIRSLTGEPYYRVVLSQKSFEEFSNWLGNEGFVAPLLDGSKMTTTPNLFKEFSKGLRFPDYFGENWNAFDECLADLEWLPGTAYCLCITEAEKVLSEEAASEASILTDILAGVSREWAQPVELGESWDRPGKPFKTVFQFSTHQNEGKIAALNMAILPEIDNKAKPD